MVIDVITFNNEHELFEIRYNILKDHIDEFIVIEFDKTFSGKPKEKTFKYQDWDKVAYIYITEDIWSKYMDMAKASPNTQGADHWKTEFAQKESIKTTLTHLKDSDIVFIGDCDEIVNPKEIKELSYYTKYNKIIKLKLQVYTYWLNNLSSEEFYGTIVGKYYNIKNECLNHIRSTYNTKFPDKIDGWHFTSMHHQIRTKLLDSYTEESYATKEVMDNLETNVNNSRDFLGRAFSYKIDESGLPEYLINNKDKYKHIWKQ